MKHRQSIQISIATPCSQKWDDMSPANRGRHCAHCNTTVIDFSTWTDKELFDFFTVNNGHICGRYLPSQLNRPIHIPYQPHSHLYQLVVAMGLTLIFIPSPSAFAQVKTESSIISPQNANNDPDGDTIAPGCIVGTITDSTKKPIERALVTIYTNGKAARTAFTNINGDYMFDDLVPREYSIYISYKYYHTGFSKTVKENETTEADYILPPYVELTYGHPTITITKLRAAPRTVTGY